MQRELLLMPWTQRTAMCSAIWTARVKWRRKQLHIALLGAMPRTHLQLTTPAALCLQVLSSGAASLVGLKQLPGAVARLQVVARRSVGGSGWCYQTMRAMSPRLRRTRALMPAVRRPRRRTVARHLMKTSRAQCVRC